MSIESVMPSNHLILYCPLLLLLLLLLLSHKKDISSNTASWTPGSCLAEDSLSV